MPTPDHTANADQLHAIAKEVLDKYCSSIENDMNRYAEQTGKSMDMTFAHHDLTRILRRDVGAGMLAALAAEGILRLIERKVKKK